MLIDVDINQVQDSLDPQGGSSEWSVYYEQPQKFSVTVRAESADEVGNVVGLTQTLTLSSRVATYDGDGKLSLQPETIPCLDADPDTKPWYNSASQGVPVTEDGITLTLEDYPSTHIPAKAKDPEGAEQPIIEIAVEESFLVTLFDETAGEALQQWTWGYSYTVRNDDEDLSTIPPPIVGEHNETEMEEVEIQDFVTEGEIAGENIERIFSPSTWKELPLR